MVISRKKVGHLQCASLHHTNCVFGHLQCASLHHANCVVGKLTSGMFKKAIKVENNYLKLYF